MSIKRKKEKPIEGKYSYKRIEIKNWKSINGKSWDKTINDSNRANNKLSNRLENN